MNISLQPRNWNGKENFKHEKPFKKKNSERAPSGIRKISGGLDFNDQHHRVVSGFLVADVSMLQAYNEVFEKYNIEDGNFRVKKELIRQYMALPIIVTLIGAIVGNILGYTVMKNVCASMYYGSYSLYTNGEIGKLYIWSTTIVVIICLLLSLPIEKAIMGVVFREMMLSSVSGWIALWIDPKIYLKMFLIGIGTYAVVSLLEYRRIRRIPMDEALKNAE